MENPFSDYAVMVLCAGDVDQIWHALGGNHTGNPNLPAGGTAGIGYIDSDNFELLGQLRCDDHFITKGDNCYYGLVLRCKTAVGPVEPGDYLVAIRGTMDPIEWVNDAVAEFPDYQTGKPGGLATGFWQVYLTMSFCDLTGGTVGESPAVSIASVVSRAPAPVYLTGHSLGAALGTYLAADLEVSLASLGTVLRPYFFASPRVGTSDYADNYQRAVSSYTLVNFAADVVPMLPSDPPFVALNGGGPTHDVHIISRNAPGAPPFPELDLGLNHNPAVYACMLDPNNAIAKQLRPGSVPSRWIRKNPGAARSG